MLKKIYWNVIQIVIGILIGLVLGVLLIVAFEEIIFSRMDTLFYLAVMILISFVLHIVIHEGGHCLFGSLFGFKTVSFRIGSYIWTNENGKMKFGRYHMAGTGGQCLMDPPNPNLKAYVFYLLGGGLANLFVSIVCIFIGLLNHDILIDIFCFSNIAVGLLISFTNLIPMDAGIPNDGLNVLYLIKDGKSVDSLYKQLKMAKELADGKRLDEIDSSYFELHDKAKLRNPLNACIAVNHGLYLSALKKYDVAKKRLEYLYKSKMTKVYKTTVAYELIFIELITMDEPNIHKYLTPELKRKMAREKNDLSSLITQYGIELLVNKNERAGMFVLKYIEDVLNTYPYNTELARESIQMIEERAKLND